MNRTNIWPAIQFNFEWTEAAKRTLTLDDQGHINGRVPFTAGGLVKIQFMGSRILITATCNADLYEKYEENLLVVLRERGIVPSNFTFPKPEIHPDVK